MNTLRVLRFLFLIACFGIVFFSQSRPYVLDVVAEMDSPENSSAEVFYSFNGSAYYPERSQVMSREALEVGSRFHSKILTNRPIKSIRLDPSDKKGPLNLRTLSIVGGGGATIRISGNSLIEAAHDLEQLQMLEATGEEVRYSTTGIDSKMFFAVPKSVTQIGWLEHLKHWLSIFGLALVLAILVELAFYVLRPTHPFRIKAGGILGRAADYLSEDATIRFSPASLVIFVSLGVLASAWVGLKLHQSSIGIWSTMNPPEHVERRLNWSAPKAIRSDEWSTFTPWILSQVKTGMQKDNPNLGAPNSALLSGSPVAGPMMLANPKYWGFLFLDIERGFSWMWAVKIFGMIASFMLLMLALTRGDALISLAVSLGVYGSSYVQWWFSSVPPEVISGFATAMVGTIYLLQSQRVGGLVFGALLAAMAVPTLLLNLYPPYLLTFAYLAVFVLVGHLGNREALRLVTTRWQLRSVMMGGAVLVWGVFVSIWYLDSRETIDVMMNTSYPGHRFELGGGRNPLMVSYGIFEVWQVDDRSVPFPPTNPPEASNLWTIFPIALLLVPMARWFSAPYRLVLWLLGFCLFAWAWASLPMPQILRLGIANAGWFLTPPSRTVLSVGVASMMLMGVLMAGSARGELKLVKWPTWLLSVIAVVVVAGYGLLLQTLDPVFFNSWRVSLAAGFVGAFVWAVHKGLRYFYLVLTLMVAALPMHVNPLQSGIEFYLNKPLFLNAQKASGPGDVWAVYGNLNIAQGFKSAGLVVLNGTHYTPRINMIKALDPDLAYRDAWNRYAHIELVEGKPGSTPVFKTIFADHYQIQLDVCGPHIRRAGVTLVAFTREPTREELQCLAPIPTRDFSGVALYRLVSS